MSAETVSQTHPYSMWDKVSRQPRQQPSVVVWKKCSPSVTRGGTEPHVEGGHTDTEGTSEDTLKSCSGHRVERGSL